MPDNKQSHKSSEPSTPSQAPKENHPHQVETSIFEIVKHNISNSPPPLNNRNILQLQRTIGNRATINFLDNRTAKIQRDTISRQIEIEEVTETTRERYDRLLEALSNLQNLDSVQESNQFDELTALLDRLAQLRTQIPENGAASDDVESELSDIETEVNRHFGQALQRLESENNAQRSRAQERVTTSARAVRARIREGQRQTALAIRATHMSGGDTETLDTLNSIGSALKTILSHVREIMGGSSAVVPLADSLLSIVNQTITLANNPEMETGLERDARIIQNTITTFMAGAGLVAGSALGPVLTVLGYIPDSIAIVGRAMSIISQHQQRENRLAAGATSDFNLVNFDAEPGGRDVGEYMVAFFAHEPIAMNSNVEDFFEYNESMLNSIINGVYGGLRMPDVDSAGFRPWLILNRHHVWRAIYGTMQAPDDHWDV